MTEEQREQQPGRKIDEIVKNLLALYVIDSSGICLYSETFQEHDTSEHLVTGFLAAIYMYSQEMGSGEIKRIELDTFKFLFREKEDKLLVISVLNQLDQDDANWLIDQIKQRYDYLQEQNVSLETLFIDIGRSLNFDIIISMREALTKDAQPREIKRKQKLVKAKKLSPRLPNVRFWQQFQNILSKFVTSNHLEAVIAQVEFEVGRVGAISVGKIEEDLARGVLATVEELKEQFASLAEPTPFEFGPHHLLVVVSQDLKIMLVALGEAGGIKAASPHLQRVMRFTKSLREKYLEGP